MDHFPPYSFRNRPVGIVTYSPGSVSRPRLLNNRFLILDFLYPGPFGGIRAGTLLRVFVAQFGMFPTPTSVVIPKVETAITDAGVLKENSISPHISKQLDEISWLATAIKDHMAVTPPPEPLPLG